MGPSGRQGLSALPGGGGALCLSLPPGRASIKEVLNDYTVKSALPARYPIIMIDKLVLKSICSVSFLESEEQFKTWYR